jgi:CrcB protein
VSSERLTAPSPGASLGTEVIVTAAPRPDGVPHARSALLVFVGGAVGTGLREALALTFPSVGDGFPLTILLVNVTGAFVLGALLGGLGRRGPDTGRRRDVRLLVGTGVLGGFTTYSAFAVDTALLLDGAAGVALLYVCATLVAGLVASALGLGVGAARAGHPSDGATKR